MQDLNILAQQRVQLNGAYRMKICAGSKTLEKRASLLVHVHIHRTEKKKGGKKKRRITEAWKLGIREMVITRHTQITARCFFNSTKMHSSNPYMERDDIYDFWKYDTVQQWLLRADYHSNLPPYLGSNTFVMHLFKFHKWFLHVSTTARSCEVFLHSSKSSFCFGQ